VALLGLTVAAGLALAHGDTIRVSYSAVRPGRLVVATGTTVHFHNANSSGAPCTVVIGDGDEAVESPPLGRAEGWHYTFESPGEYRFHLKEYPSRTGVVVVAAPPS
jgi:plastocyanin